MMRNFTKLMLTAILLVAGVGGVKAEVKTNWTPSTAYGATWTAGANTMSWEKNDNNWYILYTGFTPAVQNNSTEINLLEKYTKIHVNITSITGANNLQLKIKSTGYDEKSIDLAVGETDIVFADYSDVDFSKIKEITLWGTLSGDNENGSAVITEMYLYTDKWVIQNQEQTVTVYALGTALDLSDVVSENTLVSIASTDGDILYGAYDIATGSTGNQIHRTSLNDAMGYVNAAESGKSTYRYKITVATDDGLVLPAGVSTLYCIQACNNEGNLYRGPYGQNGFLCDIGWCTSVNKGDKNGENAEGGYFAFIPVDGKDNTYKISSYRKDGTLETENYQSKSEWILNVISQSSEQQNVDVWVENPTVTFNDYGLVTVGYESMTATGGLSYNSVTGVLTSDGAGTAGTLTLELAEAVNLEDLNTFDVKRSGDDAIVDRIKFYDSEGTQINSWSVSKWYNSGLDYNATNAFKTHNPVKKLVWELDAENNTTSKTLTITRIEWQKKTISAMKGTDITTLHYNVWTNDGDNDPGAIVNNSTPDNNFCKLTDDVIYGKQNIGDSKNYVDLTNYKKLIVRGYGTIRLFYNWAQSPESKPIDATSFVNGTTTVKTMELDIPTFMTTNGCTHFHLIGVKGSGSCFVESISVTDGTEVYDYAISGEGGMKLASAVEALADEDATAIDARGLAVSDSRLKETLTPANPNCLIVANADQLSNTSNVIVSNACAQLALTDGYPFKAPADFTATAAPTYDRTFTAKTTTVCLPFALTATEASSLGTFYKLSTFDGTYLHFTEVAAPEANKAYLVVPTATALTLSQTSKSIAATPADLGASITSVDFIGTLAATTIPASDETYSYFAYNNGDLVKVTTQAATLPAFRGYFKVSTNAISKARRLGVSFDNNATGITNVKKANGKAVYFDLQGRRVSKPNKGLYVVNGKKVVF